jgi:hypothetical protein
MWEGFLEEGEWNILVLVRFLKPGFFIIALFVRWHSLPELIPTYPTLCNRTASF